MLKRLFISLCIFLFINNASAYANQDKPDEKFMDKYYFDVDLMGVKDIYFFREFPFYDEKGGITPLGKAFLSVLTSDVWKWVREPRIYIKENIAYIHVVKLDGLNILYTLKKENSQWKVIRD